jgi:hypothetical protein
MALHTVNDEHGQSRTHRVCEVEGCRAQSRLLYPWPSGNYDHVGEGWKRVVGRPRGQFCPGFDVCPACMAAGKLPAGALNPQPYPPENI